MTAMRCFVLLQAMGDNLITLSMLAQAEEKIEILGTRLTYEVAKLLDIETKFNIRVLFGEVPAFYDVRKAGVWKAVKEIGTFRRYIRREALTDLVFEKGDVRAGILTYGIARYRASETSEGVYLDRKSLIELAAGVPVTLKPAARPVAPVRTVVIAPHSRVREKDIRDTDLTALINVLKKEGLHLRLVDHTGTLDRYRNRVDEYYTHTTLAEVRDLIVDSDFMIGCDSFLIHLAYYFDKAFFVVFNAGPSDFLPPGCETIGNFIVADHAEDKEDAYRRKFSALGVIA